MVYCRTVHCFQKIWPNKRTHSNERRNAQRPPCCHSWRHLRWQRNGPQTNQLSGQIFTHNLGNSPIQQVWCENRGEVMCVITFFLKVPCRPRHRFQSCFSVYSVASISSSGVIFFAYHVPRLSKYLLRRCPLAIFTTVLLSSTPHFKNTVCCSLCCLNVWQFQVFSIISVYIQLVVVHSKYLCFAVVCRKRWIRNKWKKSWSRQEKLLMQSSFATLLSSARYCSNLRKIAKVNTCKFLEFPITMILSA